MTFWNFWFVCNCACINFNENYLTTLNLFLYDIFHLEKVNLEFMNFWENDILKLLIHVQLCINFNGWYAKGQ